VSEYALCDAVQHAQVALNSGTGRRQQISNGNISETAKISRRMEINTDLFGLCT